MAILSYQQKLGLTDAVKAAVTAPSTSNPITTAAEVTTAKSEVAALQPWEESAGVVQVKSGFGSSGCKVGTDSVTYIADGDDSTGDWDGTKTGGSVGYSAGAWSIVSSKTQSLPASSTINYGNYNTSNSGSPGYAVSASNEYPAGGQYAAWKAVDGIPGGGDGWLANATTGWWKINFGTAKTVSTYQMLGAGYAGSSPGTWKLYGSATGAFAGEEVEVDSRTGQTFGVGVSSPLYTCASPGSYQHYKINITANQGGSFCGFWEIKFCETADSSITTNDIATGTVAFNPLTLDVKDESGVTISGDGKFLIAYDVNGGGMSSLVEQSVFKALSASIFSATTDLRLKVVPVGAQKIGSVNISNVSSGVLTTKAGAITMTVSGLDVYKVESDGDVTTADITADDITMTGNLNCSGEGNFDGNVSVGASNEFQTFRGTTSTADGSTKVVASVLVGADAAMAVHAVVTANEAASANKNKYVLEGFFYRNGSGNVTQLGDLVSVDTNEGDIVWDATLVANTSTQSVDVRVSGEAGTTVGWKTFGYTTQG